MAARKRATKKAAKKTTKKAAKKTTRKKKAYVPESEIEAAVLEATGLTGPKARESEEDYRARLARAGASLDDDAWEEVPEDAQEWVNAAMQAVNEEEEAPPFSDLEDDEDESDDESDEDESEDDDEADDEEADDDEDEDDSDEDEDDEDDDDESDEDEDDDDSEDEDDEDDSDEDEEEPVATKKTTKKTTRRKPAAKKTSRKAASKRPAKKAAKKTARKGTKKAAAKKAPAKKKGPSKVMRLRKILCKLGPDATKAKFQAAINKANIEVADYTITTVFSHTSATLKVLRELGKID